MFETNFISEGKFLQEQRNRSNDDPESTGKEDTNILSELSSKNLEQILQKKKSKLLELSQTELDNTKGKDMINCSGVARTGRLLTPTKNGENSLIIRKTPGKENLANSLYLMADSKEVLMREIESLITQKESLEEQVLLVKEGAIEALIEKEKVIIELDHKLKILSETSANSLQRESREEIKRLLEENENLRSHLILEKETLEQRVLDLTQLLERERVNYRRTISMSLDECEMSKKSFKDLQDSMLSQKLRESELMEEIQTRERIVRNLEKELAEEKRLASERFDQLAALEKQLEKSQEDSRRIKERERRMNSDSFLILNQNGGNCFTMADELNALRKKISNYEHDRALLNGRVMSLEKDNERLNFEKESLKTTVEELEAVNAEFELYLEKTKENFEKSLQEVQERSKCEIQMLKNENMILKEYERIHADNMSSNLNASNKSLKDSNVINNNNPNPANQSLKNEIEQAFFLSPRFSASKLFHLGTQNSPDKSKKNKHELEEDIKLLREYIIKSEEQWANENNFLREELKSAETVAVEAKLQLAQLATDKDYLMFKYRSMVEGIQRGKNTTKAKPAQGVHRNLFDDWKKFSFFKK